MRRSTLIALLGGFVSAAVFCVRWRSCLPFSGFMPAIEDRDSLTAWGIQLIYAREPISFPLGVVHGLSYPFGDSYDLLSRGPMALFSIFFKVLGKVLPYFQTFYFFPLVEILAVFFTAYFAARLVQDVGVTSDWSPVLASVFTGLSFPLLFRSSQFYYLTLFVVHVPFFLGYAHAVALVARGRHRLGLIGISIALILSALIDYYLFFAMLVLSIGVFVLFGLRAVRSRDAVDIRSAGLIGAATSAGILLAFLSLEAVGNFARLENTSSKSLMEGRHDDRWGYGGGKGGGFHVADLLVPIIPPHGGENTPPWLRGGPASYLTQLGWPLTTASLGEGQYEGFAYLGTVPLLLVAGLSVSRTVRFRQQFKRPGEALVFVLRSAASSIARLPWTVTLALPAIVLFSISLGYVLHVGGIRFGQFPTPALYAAAAYPKFEFARALGRFDVPFVLLLLISTVAWLDRATCDLRRGRRLMVSLAVLAMIVVHVSEVYGYLAAPASFPSDVIVDEFVADVEMLQSISGTGPIIPVPELRDNVAWGRVCYALAYHTGRPLAGSDVGLGVLRLHRQVFAEDRNAVLAGRISDLRKRYGDLLIAVAPAYSDSVVARGGSQLSQVSMTSEKVALYLTQEYR